MADSAVRRWVLVANTREDLSEDLHRRNHRGNGTDISAGNDEEPIAKNWVQAQSRSEVWSKGQPSLQ
ncbi:hypothetical protein PGT21_013141 [Puccinia graminis f. sp. tritici]|uniref:Uncharacterized protein n=1 Tax=Puccinia graminis f. sp. tritici TaxID=56615 RepID=A0A5B0LKF2_PUCGR|nr:hypothetical protein PGT21_013141 [Puccinia graminis f. sp. tritici]